MIVTSTTAPLPERRCGPPGGRRPWRAGRDGLRRRRRDRGRRRPPAGAQARQRNSRLARQRQRQRLGARDLRDALVPGRRSPARTARREPRRRRARAGARGCARAGRSAAARRHRRRRAARGGMLMERLVHVDGEPVVVRAAQPARDRVVLRARRGGRAAAHARARRRSRGCASRSASTTTCGRSTTRFRYDPLDRPVACARARSCAIRAAPSRSRRSPGRSASSSSSSRARRRSSGGSSRRLGPPLRAHRPARPADRRRRWRQRRRRCSSRSTSAPAGRWRCVRAAREVARGPRRPPRARPRARLGAPARDPGHRRVDDRRARAARPGPLRPRAGRRPRLHQARRAACCAGDPRARADRGRGARVLRALRRWAGLAGAHALGEPGGRLAARDAAAVHGVSPESPTPSPGRNSLVSTRAGGRRLREQAVVDASSWRRPATAPGPASRTACSRPRGRRPAASP